MNITGIFIVASLSIFFGLWLLFDIFVELYAKQKLGWSTITHWTITYSKLYPAIPFTVGFIGGALAGHLFFQF